jgi:cysteine-rich repeat protein
VRHLARALSVFLLAACSANLGVDTRALRVSCAAPADCPSPLRCIVDLGVCILPGTACSEERDGALVSSPEGSTCRQENDSSGICRTGVCEPSLCGDGFLDLRASEVCDDGGSNSDVIPGACRSTCQLAHCGDSVVDLGEACDDGNDSDADPCLRTCERNVCGDGKINAAGEACDDGNMSNEDGCLVSCAANVCGDGFINPGTEACDDANDNPNDGCDQCQSTHWNVQVSIGLGSTAGDPKRLSFGIVGQAATDRAGNVLTCDVVTNLCYRIDVASNRVSVLAGGGTSLGDGGPATLAQLSSPRSVVTDAAGHVYIGENARVRRIDARTGIITTYAGTGNSCPSTATPGGCGEGGPATAARLRSPAGLAMDARKNLFIADIGAHVIWQVVPSSGVIYVAAGDLANRDAGGFAGEGQPAGDAQFNAPFSVVVVGDGMLVVNDQGNRRIRRIDLNNDVVTTIAGTGALAPSVDGATASTASLGSVLQLSACDNGDLLFAENYKVRRLSGDVLSTVAGTGTYDFAHREDGPALSTHINPFGVQCRFSGDVLLTDTNARSIRLVESGNVRTIGGGEMPGRFREGGASKSFALTSPRAIAFSPSNELHISDGGSVFKVVKETGDVALVFGGPQTGIEAEGEIATESSASLPGGLAFNTAGELHVASYGAHAIRKVGADGRVTTVMGTLRSAGFSGDGGPATAASLSSPQALTFDAADTMYVYDGGNRRIRKVANGVASTVAGNGSPCATATDVCGDGLAPLSAQLGDNSTQTDHPNLQIAADGSLYYSDPKLVRVRKVDFASNTMVRIAGTGAQCLSAATCGDGGAASAAVFGNAGSNTSVLGGIAFDFGGRLLIGDARLRVVDAPVSASSLIGTLALTGSNIAAGISGDGGAPTSATDFPILSVAVDRDGNPTFLTAKHVRRVRGNTIETLVGIDAPGDGPIARSTMTQPRSLVAIAGLGILIADASQSRIRAWTRADERLRTLVGTPGGASTLAKFSRLLREPVGMAYDAASQKLYVTERGSVLETLRVVSLTNVTDPSTWTVSDLPISGLGRTPGNLVFSAGQLFVSDDTEHTLRAIDLEAGVSTLVMGTPFSDGDYCPEGADANTCLLYRPNGLTFAPDGSLLVVDGGNNKIHRLSRDSAGQISPHSKVETLFGDFDAPSNVAFDRYGNLFVTTRASVLRATPVTGALTGQEPMEVIYGRTPRDRFPESVTRCLSAVLPDESGDKLYVSDACNGFVMTLSRTALP